MTVTIDLTASDLELVNQLTEARAQGVREAARMILAELGRRQVASIIRRAPFAVVHKKTGRAYVFGEAREVAEMMWGRNLLEFDFLCRGQPVTVKSSVIGEIERILSDQGEVEHPGSG